MNFQAAAGGHCISRVQPMGSDLFMVRFLFANGKGLDDGYNQSLFVADL